MHAVTFSSVNFSYNNVRVLYNHSMSVQQQEMVVLAGKNGAGKTTLLKLILGLLTPDSGDVKVYGSSVGANTKKKIGYLPQRHSVINFPVSALETVLLGRWGMSFQWLRRASRMDYEAALAALQKVGIGDLVKRDIRMLSGGQQQKVYLARALVRNPEILLLDEPYTHLDAPARINFIDTVYELHDSLGLTTVIVSHNPLDHCDGVRSIQMGDAAV